MTMAVCFRCGIIKFGAFVPCPECAAAPRGEDELARSLAMTDHYFPMHVLEQMGAAVRDGNPPALAPESRAQLIAMIRETDMARLIEELPEEPGDDSVGERE